VLRLTSSSQESAPPVIATRRWNPPGNRFVSAPLAEAALTTVKRPTFIRDRRPRLTHAGPPSAQVGGPLWLRRSTQHRRAWHA